MILMIGSRSIKGALSEKVSLLLLADLAGPSRTNRQHQNLSQRGQEEGAMRNSPPEDSTRKTELTDRMVSTPAMRRRIKAGTRMIALSTGRKETGQLEDDLMSILIATHIPLQRRRMTQMTVIAVHLRIVIVILPPLTVNLTGRARFTPHPLPLHQEQLAHHRPLHHHHLRQDVRC